MTSTTKSLKYNTRERALSTDLNREQNFLSSELAQFARSLLLTPYPTTGTPYYSFNETITEPSVTDRPIRAAVLQGLAPYPINGTTDLLITSGQLLQVQATGGLGADDFEVALVTDEGVQTTGILTLTPNSSGSGRVDIVECKVIDYDYETSSRDVYDPGTGLFTVASLVKVTGKKLQYRIRTGDPSSVWPGIVDEWLPLCVLVVPDGTTDFDTVDMYDVRPLVTKRAQDISEVSENLPQFYQLICNYDLTNQHKIAPIMNVGFKNQRVRWGDGNAVASSPLMLDLQSADLRDPAWTPVASEWWRLYLAFPFGLPRWAKYSDSTTSPRKGQREGIPIMTNKICGFYGNATLTCALPTATGLVGTVETSEMFCVVSGFVDSGGTIRGTMGDKNKLWISPQSTVQPNVTATTLTDTQAKFNTRLIVPPNARKARIRVAIAHGYIPGSDDEVHLGNHVLDVKALYPTTTTAIQEYLHISNDSTFLKSGFGYSLLTWFIVEIPGYCDLQVDLSWGTATTPTVVSGIAYLVDWAL